MANNENLIPIPGRLHSVATEGHVAGANEIYDDTLAKDQATINSEVNTALGTGGTVDSRIAAAKAEIIGNASSDYNTLGKVENKVEDIADNVAYIDDSSSSPAVVPSFDPESQTVHVTAQTLSEQQKAQVRDNIGLGDVDERIAVEKNRAEQAEGVLDGKVATEKQRAEGVEGGLNTRLQTVEQLATISVGGGDIGIGTAADFESDDPEDLAKVPTISAMLGGANDGVYDISARHSGAKYADLAAALGTNGANVPVGVRRGGMSVKFVQSSDNKYVQWRLMADTWSTNVSDWQGVSFDDEDFYKVAAYKSKQNKIPSVDVISKVFGQYINSSKYKKAITDKDEIIICAIENDDNVFFATGVPKQIVNYINNSIEDISNFLGELVVGDKTLLQLLYEKVDKVEGKSLINKDYADSVYYINSDTFVYIIADKDGIIIQTIDKNMNFHFNSEKHGNIVCWGDSLTAGAGSNDLKGWASFCSTLVSMGYPDFSSQTSMSYVKMLQLLMGIDYQTINCGVGGESIISICARFGSEQAYIPSDITLPANGTYVDIVRGTDVGLPSKYGANKYAKNLRQGENSQVNPIHINGIECTLAVELDSGGYPTAYKVKRNKVGSVGYLLKQGTPITMIGSKIKETADISILWCGANAGYDSAEDFANILSNMVKSLPTNKYIIIGLHSGTYETKHEQEELLEKVFGDKYFNWRRYVSSMAIQEFGITPTTEDEEAMSLGKIPPCFLHDNTHLNAVGYSVLGIKINEKIKILNY